MFSRPQTKGQLWYQGYINSSAFKKLRVIIVGKKCYICEFLPNSNINIPHHVNYRNLYEERLWRDIYPLCYNCHNQAHFFMLFGIFKIKVPLNEFFLRKRLYYLRLKYCIRKRYFFRSIWAFLTCVFGS